jgi:hypothetical protein
MMHLQEQIPILEFTMEMTEKGYLTAPYRPDNVTQAPV